ncbi:MAG: frataxin domain-containing protein [Gallionella sp.]
MNQEIWVAAKSGGFHYAYQNGAWYSRRDNGELFSKVVELFAEQKENLELA